MPWKTMDVREQRMQFVVTAKRREKSFTALCQEFGISRPTGCLWVKRYQQQGVAGVAEHSRRPQRSSRLTATVLQDQVVELRRQYPDWGARKLRVLLERQGVDVVCQEVVDIESGSADGWFLVESSVRSMPVVLVDPRRSEEHTSELQSLRH